MPPSTRPEGGSKTFPQGLHLRKARIVNQTFRRSFFLANRTLADPHDGHATFFMQLIPTRACRATQVRRGPQALVISKLKAGCFSVRTADAS